MASCIPGVAAKLRGNGDIKEVVHNLVEGLNFGLCPSLLQSIPTELSLHDGWASLGRPLILRFTSVMACPVVHHTTCSTALKLLQFVNILCSVRIPYD